MIGDNLNCHFSEEVLNACLENDIAFIPLIPNTTHLSQPLDISVFKPSKSSWDVVLKEWRRESRVIGSIPKTIFPSLLKRTIGAIEPKMTTNLVSGK